MKMPKKMKTIPRFKSEDKEREFWASADSTEYVDWRKGKRVAFSNLKPSTRAISIRLPESLIEALKLLANKRDVPYQSLLKIFLAERVEEELHTGD
jgi:predicted DNA binding CopG/RHH family protein